MATIVTVACDNNTKICTGKITGKDATLTDQEGINRWLNNIRTVNASLSSTGLAAESAEPLARSAAGSAAESAAAGSALAGSANSSALVAFESSPMKKSLDQNILDKLLARVSSQPKPVITQFFQLASMVPLKQIPTIQPYILKFLEKSEEEQNIVFNNLLENKPSNLEAVFEVVPYTPPQKAPPPPPSRILSRNSGVPAAPPVATAKGGKRRRQTHRKQKRKQSRVKKN